MALPDDGRDPPPAEEPPQRRARPRHASGAAGPDPREADRKRLEELRKLGGPGPGADDALDELRARMRGAEQAARALADAAAAAREAPDEEPRKAPPRGWEVPGRSHEDGEGRDDDLQ